MATRCKTGSIPSGLPSFARPRLTGSQALSLIGPASGIVLVRFSDSILTTRSFAARRNEAVDADQQLLAFSVVQILARQSAALKTPASVLSRCDSQGFRGAARSWPAPATPMIWPDAPPFE